MRNNRELWRMRCMANKHHKHLPKLQIDDVDECSTMSLHWALDVSVLDLLARQERYGKMKQTFINDKP